MTHDPERLIHDTAHPLQRELLSCLRELAPPEGALEQGLRELLRDVALLGAAGTAAATAPTPTTALVDTTARLTAKPAVTLGTKVATQFVSTKLVLGLAAAGVGVGGSLVALRPPDRAAESLPVVSSPAATTTSTPKSSIEIAATAAAAATPEPGAPTPNPAVRTSAPRADNDALLRESAALVEARARLRQGDKAAAHAALQKLDAEFPRGKLTQEREVLRIEVLSSLGQRQAAAQRAQTFLKRYPQSPHAAHVRRFLDAP